jgi:hypothetical protein
VAVGDRRLYWRKVEDRAAATSLPDDRYTITER